MIAPAVFVILAGIKFFYRNSFKIIYKYIYMYPINFKVKNVKTVKGATESKGKDSIMI